MSKKFTIEDLLREVNVVPSTKTAEEKNIEKESKTDLKGTKGPEAEAVTPMPATAQIGTEMAKDQPVHEVEEKSIEKKQERSSPVDDAIKMAEELAGLEKSALIKEANLIGQALIDGAMARVQQYEKVAYEMQNAGRTKEAAEMEKIAELYETDEDFRNSLDQGYMDKVAEMQNDYMSKIAAEIESDPEASAAFRAGYEKTASEIIKVATHMQDKGYVEAANVISKMV
jgi:hypothetical protein